MYVGACVSLRARGNPHQGPRPIDQTTARVPSPHDSSTLPLDSSQVMDTKPTTVMAPVPDARHDSWTADRLAQFIANAISGVVVVTSIVLYAVWSASVQDQTYRFFMQLSMNRHMSSCWDHKAAGGVIAFAECLGVIDVWEEDIGADILDSFMRQLSRAVTLTSIACGVLFLASKYKSIGWYLWLQTVTIIQWIFALYQVARITISASTYFSIKTVKVLAYAGQHLHARVFRFRKKHATALRQVMKQAKSYAEWVNMARYLDILEDKEHWKDEILPEDQEHCDFQQLQKNMHDLRQAVEAKNIDALKYILTSFVMRNKVGIDAADLHLECSSGTKHVIEKYNSLVVVALKLLSDASPELFPPTEKTMFFRKLKQSFGSTALCLSGGGAIAMYHMGVIKALLQADILPNVISGSSGGSIAAAMAACKTNEELINTIIQRDISTRYYHHGIWWFPPLFKQLVHCIKTGFLVECSDFERTTQHYYGEPLDLPNKHMYYTFQDAYLKTGRHVCITVSASDVTGHKGPKKLLLNHINTPHVLLWSAVAVSCSLPGIMKGKKLMARDHEGNVVPYDAMGKEWVDGSIQHDLPMETMASCFNVTNFIVSQVNPHVVPFMGEDVHTPGFRKSIFHTLESVIAADVRHRLKMLAFLGLFPKIYGHQFSSYFKQNFRGNVTLIPDFIFLEAIGVKAIVNPTREDMDRYILGGQRAVWPKLAYIGHLCGVEKCLDACLASLLPEDVATQARYTNWFHPRSVL